MNPEMICAEHNFSDLIYTNKEPVTGPQLKNWTKGGPIGTCSQLQDVKMFYHRTQRVCSG